MNLKELYKENDFCHELYKRNSLRMYMYEFFRNVLMTFLKLYMTNKSYVNIFSNVVFVKDFPKSVHVHGFTPEFNLSCRLRFPSSVNDFPQRVHVNCFTTECIRSCSVRLLTRANVFPQGEHGYGFTPECILSWSLS